MKVKPMITLALAGAMFASMSTFAGEPPKMKMTTEIPASIKIPDQEFFDAHFDKRNNGQPAADNELYHCSFFEVDGKEVKFRDYDSESGKVYDWFRVVKDDDGKVVVRENSVVRPRPPGNAR